MSTHVLVAVSPTAIREYSEHCQLLLGDVVCSVPAQIWAAVRADIEDSDAACADELTDLQRRRGVSQSEIQRLRQQHAAGRSRLLAEHRARLLPFAHQSAPAPAQSRRPTVLSYGGGLNSFALLVDAIQRGQLPDVCIFLDVTDTERLDPGEWPGTYAHIRDVAMPLCARHGIPFVWLDTTSYPVRGARSLFSWLWERKQIPVAGPNRLCTTIAKVERFEAWLDHTYPGQDVEVWIGFEAGEESRAAADPNAGTGARASSKRGASPARRHNRFPLMERQLCRCRCEALVRDAGYPVPRKSACVYCPYGTRGDWQTLARDLPEAFARVVELEAQKPPTKRGIKLSIMGYRTVKDRAGTVLAVKAPPLAEYVQSAYRARPSPCAVCGASARATKAVGCVWL